MKGSLTGTLPVLQIHPTRRCNLRCQHCYSLSGPAERDELPVDLVCAAIAAARAEGYRVLSVSGGEPLLYGGLVAILAAARGEGMRTAVATNGMLLDARRLARLQGAVDLLAISLDGTPDSHTRMRGSPTAFTTMAGRLASVRESGIPFGFIFTLTQHNLDELEWVVQFALENGARLVQVHPLEDVGRARELLAGARPDPLEAAYAFLEVRRLQELAGDRLYIQFDVVDRDGMQRQPGRVYADDAPDDVTDRALADLVAPLVIEPDGTVVPLEYGFARRFALGNLREQPLPRLATRWRCEQYSAFRALCRRVFAEVIVPAPLPFFNWYELIGARAALSA